ncbi:outer membrane immunogenic protein [Methylosinus sp. sav-2]|uniref:outer membrane protein n=1 Tax=Methylosinus sp. sav-2 TaxID=2485168 RepID=UPI00047E3A69|nr:outer membrane beta-barrel protein [Methylosinus sp. sav-2]TDX67402.1 outer membrane immunogenic protein [Methylosinus sp. sav-2]
MKRLAATIVCVLFGLGAAHAQDIALAKIVAPAVVVPLPPPPLWGGAYVGLNAGWGFGGSNEVPTFGTSIFDWAAGALGMPFGFSSPYVTGLARLEQSGFLGGAQLGYNHLWSPNILLGVETDIDGAIIRGSGSSQGFAGAVDEHGLLHLQTGVASTRAGLSWLGSLRGRLGYIVAPSLLVYGTGGLAYGGGFANVFTYGAHWHPQDPIDHPDNPVTPNWGNYSDTRTGWIAGGGLEWMFAPRWSLKVEGLYYDLGEATLSTSPSAVINPAAPGSIAILNIATTRVKYDGAIARFGVDYHFGWVDPPPVVAKY